MSREMEILADIAEQNELRGNIKERRSTTKGGYFGARRVNNIFSGMKTGQLRRKPKVTLSGRAREEERGQG